MSEHDKAFAQFPGANDTFFFIDIFAIEAIGQSQAPEVATIFMTSQTFYSIEVELETLKSAGCATAAEFAYATIAQVASAAAESPDALRSEDLGDEDEDFAEQIQQALADPTAG